MPSADAVLQMEPDALAVHLLDCLCKLEDSPDWEDDSTSFRSWELLCRSHFIQPANFTGYCSRDDHERLGLALSQAWSWLERHGLIVPRPEMSGFVVVTEAGRRLRKEADPRVFKALALLPLGVLDEQLDARARPAFLRGDYSSALFEAFKRVEVVVRESAGLPNTLYGHDLVREAFNPERGILTDSRQPESERLGLAHVFDGAMLALKNPTSHRDADITDPIVVAELLVFADALLRIARKHGDLTRLSSGSP